MIAQIQTETGVTVSVRPSYLEAATITIAGRQQGPDICAAVDVASEMLDTAASRGSTATSSGVIETENGAVGTVLLCSERSLAALVVDLACPLVTPWLETALSKRYLPIVVRSGPRSKVVHVTPCDSLLSAIRRRAAFQQTGLDVIFDVMAGLLEGLGRIEGLRRLKFEPGALREATISLVTAVDLSGRLSGYQTSALH